MPGCAGVTVASADLSTEAFVASFTRPRVVGDWRGEPRPVQAEA